MSVIFSRSGGIKKMKKILLVGFIFTIFLLFMQPNVHAIEYQNQKYLITSKLAILDSSSFVKMVKQTPKNEWRILLKNIIQIVMKIIRFILEIIGTIVSITKEAVTLVISTVFHILKAIITFILCLILAIVFLFIAVEVVVIIIFVIWAIFSSLPLSSTTSYAFITLLQSI